MSDLERTYTPTEAAEEYGFAPSLLRRYAAIYESLGGTIAHDKRGGRIYSADLLAHFRSARKRVKTGEKVEDALRTLELAPTDHVQDAQTGVDAQQVLTALERVLSSNEALKLEVGELRDQVAELARQQLNPPEPEKLPTDDGLLVRAAQWLESRLKGRS